MKCFNCGFKIEGTTIYKTLKPSFRIISLCCDCGRLYKKGVKMKELKGILETEQNYKDVF